MISEVSPFNGVELLEPKSGRKFTINGHKLKHYLGGEVDRQRFTSPLSWRIARHQANDVKRALIGRQPNF